MTVIVMRIKYVPLLLVAAIAGAFVLQSSIGGFTESFALASSEAASEPWLLVTSTFLHGDLAHLLGNIFALGLFGLILEGVIGSRKFILLYFASGIVSGIASVFFYESAIGASGAIFGILGALAALRPRMIVWTYGVPMPMVAAAGFWLLLDMLGAFYPSNVANAAHIAGLAFGVAAGLVALRKYRERHAARRAGRPLSDKEFSRWEEEWM